MTLHELPTNWNNGLLQGMTSWAYNVTQGWYWALMLLGFCFVMMIAASRFGGPRSFGFASVVGLLGATFLAIAGLMAWAVASIFIITGLVGFAVMILSER